MVFLADDPAVSRNMLVLLADRLAKKSHVDGNSFLRESGRINGLAFVSMERVQKTDEECS